MFELTPFAHRHRDVLYHPFQELEAFEKNFFGDSSPTGFQTDIKDTEKAYELEADLPGFQKEDIKIDLEDQYLTIRAERSAQSEEKDRKGNYVKRERFYGSFSRSFDVSNVKTDQIEATYQNGVLKLVMPKKEESRPAARRLEIK